MGTREGAPARADRLAELSRSLWLRRFGGDPGLIGRALLLDGESYRVSGIMPSDFLFPVRGVEVWALLAVNAVHDRGMHDLEVVLRRRDSSSWTQARAEFILLMQRMLERGRDSKKAWMADLTPLREWYAAGTQRMLWILAGAVALNPASALHRE